MENRFGIRDLVICILLVILIVLQLMGMVQFDRQWTDVKQLNVQLSQLVSEQTRMRDQLTRLDGRLQQGVQMLPGQAVGTEPNATAQATGNQNLPHMHARIQKARDIEDFVQGDWLIDAFSANVPSLTAMTYKDLNGRRVQEFVLEALIALDPETLEVIPHLATDWTIQENKEQWQAYIDMRKAVPLTEEEIREEPGFPDTVDTGDLATAQNKYIEQRLEEGRTESQIAREAEAPPALTITFQLRQGVVFSDGHPLTADDVVFSFELMNEPRLDAAAMRQFYDNIKYCAKKSDYEVEFGLKEPHFMALSMCGGRAVLPKHFYEKYTIDDINRMPGLLMGSGPYRMPDPAGWKPGNRITLHRNERYWGPPSAFNQIIFQEVTNDVARLTMFRNGEIDFFRANSEQYDDLRGDPKVMERSNALEFTEVPSGYTYISWNQLRDGKRTKFADKRVRQALTYLTERERIARQILRGYAQVANGPFSPGSPQRNPDVPTREYDLAKGRQLLREAGWDDRNRDGVLENERGETFRFKLTYSSGSELTEQMVLFIKDSYARAGIVVELDPLEWSVFSERMSQQDFDAVMMGWGGGAVEGDIRQMFHSSQVNKGADNFMNYINPQLDQLIDEARRTLDEEKRMKLWHQCHAILHEDQPYTFMFNSKSLRIVDKRIRNIQYVTEGINAATEWFVPGPMQKWGK